MLEISFDDLNEEAQGKILEYYHIHSPEEMNFETVPLFVLERGDSEDRVKRVCKIQNRKEVKKNA